MVVVTLTVEFTSISVVRDRSSGAECVSETNKEKK